LQISHHTNSMPVATYEYISGFAGYSIADIPEQ